MIHIAPEICVSLTRKREDVVAEGARRKSNLAIDIVINPLSLKHLNLAFALFAQMCAHDVWVLFSQCGDDDRVKFGFESASPLAEGTCIVGANVADGIDDERIVGASREGLDEVRDGWEEATGEDPFANKVDFFGVRLKASFWDRDDLHTTHCILVLECPTDAAPVFLQKFFTNCLNHLDANHAIESALPFLWHSAIVHEMDANLAAVLFTHLSNALLCEFLLGNREREGVDGAASETDGLDGERTPSGTNLEDTMMWLNIGFADDVVNFTELGRKEFILFARQISDALAMVLALFLLFL